MPGITVGGQAVIEGVMMRTPGIMSIAVRRNDGNIILHNDLLIQNPEKTRLLLVPIIRGVMILSQSVILGFRALDYSSYFAAENRLTATDHTNARAPVPDRSLSSIRWLPMASLILALSAFIGFFLAFPLLLTDTLQAMTGLNITNSFFLNLIEGSIRLVLVFIYIYAISAIPEIRRVFQYHGAEHKAIFAYEAGMELTAENARQFSRFHPRCGTALLFTLMLFSILVFSIIPTDLSFFMKVALRISLIPFLAGISYEVIRKYSDSMSVPARILFQLSAWLQILTTREPDDEHLEVGIVALKSALQLSTDNQSNLTSDM